MLTAGLACALSPMAMGIHVRAKQGVHAGLVATPLRPEPLDNIRIDAQRKQGLVGWGVEPPTYDSLCEHLRSPRRSVVIDNDRGLLQRCETLHITCGLGRGSRALHVSERCEWRRLERGRRVRRRPMIRLRLQAGRERRICAHRSPLDRLRPLPVARRRSNRRRESRCRASRD